MSTMSYISVIERYHEYRDAIQELLSSIITGIADEPIFTHKEKRCKTIQSLRNHYPFVSLIYVLDKNGVQVGDNVATSSQDKGAYKGDGLSRAQRPYYSLAKASDDAIVTEPYLSTCSRKLCLSATIKQLRDGKTYYLVVDSDLTSIIEFLMGDAERRRIQPFFKGIYASIVAGLFIVVIALLYTAYYEVWMMVTAPVADTETQLKPFSVIIFLTLALAIFDLGKTTLEEEVLMHKDIFRHSSTRRTITRFIAAILIAVSIESLLLMFKGALGDNSSLIPAVWMMLATVGLLIGLGIYVYLGAKAEMCLKGRQN